MADIVLQTEGLTKRFGKLIAVDGLGLEVREGEVFGFLGPNGAGKTTSISMMCGLLKPDAGRVLIGGQPIHGGDPSVRARVGVCPQDIVIWPRLTCLEQLVFVGRMYGLGGAEARRRGATLLDDLGLTEKADMQARTLSGGMQRRLNLALALVHDPGVVVLDEPEAGLDPQSRVRVREYIQRLARDKTVILTTHNMDEAERVADRVAIIDRGKLLVVDTPEALRRSVGDGDVVEVEVAGDFGARADRDALLAALGEVVDAATLDPAGTRLTLRALDAVRKLPGALDRVEAAGLTTGEIRLRANTLEDVFIQLTGRSLRE